MAVVFSIFFQAFTDLGFGSAIIQRDDNVLTNKYLSTAFWGNFIWAIIVYAIMVFAVSPFAAIFYHEKSLMLILPILGLNIIVCPLYKIHQSLFYREFKFKKIAFISNVASLVSGTAAIILAIYGAGVWALVLQSVLVFFIELPYYYFNSKWRPQFIWDKLAFKDLFGFGIFTTFSSLLNKLSAQGDYLIVGKFLGKVNLGFYSFAFILSDSLRIQIRLIIEKVMYPVYSKFKNDKTKQDFLLQKSIFFNSILITPIMGAMFVSPELITIVFGDKWQKSIILIKIISISVIVQIITNSYSSIMLANNKSYFDFKLNVVKVFLIFFPLVIVGTYFYGVLGCSIAVLISRILFNYINIYTLKKQIDLDTPGFMKSYFSGILPTIISLIITMCVFYWFTNTSILFVILKSTFFALSVVVFSYLLNKDEILKLVSIIKN
jgi:O-antigen/teichoic acid export membrane protein